MSFSCQQGSPSQAESDEEDLATDQQMLALYDADPVKTEQDFGVDAVFIQELRDHVAEAEQRLARLRQVAVDDIHVYPKGGESSADLRQHVEQVQSWGAIASAALSASDESDIDVTVDSCGNQDVEVKSAGKDEQALAAQNVPKATMESNVHQKHGNGEDKEVLAMRSYKAWQDHDATGSNTKESKSQSAERHTRSTVAEGVRCLPRLGLVLCLHCMMGVMLT